MSKIFSTKLISRNEEQSNAGKCAVGITYEIGDSTSKARIKENGRKSAEAMMEILLKR